MPGRVGGRGRSRGLNAGLAVGCLDVTSKIAKGPGRPLGNAHVGDQGRRSGEENGGDGHQRNRGVPLGQSGQRAAASMLAMRAWCALIAGAVVWTMPTARQATVTRVTATRAAFMISPSRGIARASSRPCRAMELPLAGGSSAGGRPAKGASPSVIACTRHAAAIARGAFRLSSRKTSRHAARTVRSCPQKSTLHGRDAGASPMGSPNRLP
jgi:hypothetical protein